MVQNMLQKKTDPLSYNRVPFEKVSVKKPMKSPSSKTSPTKYSRLTHKPMGKPKSWTAPGSEIPVNASKQPRGTVFGAKII